MHRFAVYFAGTLLVWIIWAIPGCELVLESDEVTRTAKRVNPLPFERLRRGHQEAKEACWLA